MLRKRSSLFTLILLSLLLVIVLPACESGSGNTLFKKRDGSETGINFANNLNYTDSLTVLDFEYMFNGAGVAVIDINNDGLQDLFFAGNMVSSRLYLNKGNLQFEDITEKAGLVTTGWAYGASVVDINEDGYADIYLCKAGNRKTDSADMENQFFINNRNNTFSNQAANMNLNSRGYDIHAAFFDYDKDGDLDMYLLRNAFVNYNRNTARTKLTNGAAPSTDRLFRNEGNGHFTDISEAAGITIEGFGLGVSICDLNNDNWPDVYVSNDFLTNDLIWINNHDGTFTNKAGAMMRHQTYNGMGNDVADYNNDGLEDVMVVDMLPPDNKRWKLTMRGNTYEEFQNALSFGYEPQYVRNTLQLNNGDGTFSEIGQLAGVHATEWSWSPLFADVDNDGYKDLFVSNGYRQDITNLDFIKYGKKANFVGTPAANRRERLLQLKKYPGIEVHNYLFKNNRDLTFKDASIEFGLTDPGYSNGAVYADLDNDGDLDLVTNNLDQQSVLYENRANEHNPRNNWLRLKFTGMDKNRQGIGAKAWLWQQGQRQYQYLSPYRGYLSTAEPVLHFGAGSGNIDSVQVLWPDGATQTIRLVKPNQLLIVEHKASVKGSEIKPAEPQNPTYFSLLANAPAFRHEEDEYVDFKLQPLLPKNYSHEGPALAVGDINGDGLEDLFAGAAAKRSGGFFLQGSDGSFGSRLSLPDSNLSDNMGALLLDVDNDGHNDLYLAAGGTLTNKSGDPVYQHRLYLNDGKGHFTSHTEALEGIVSSASGAIAADYDRDGDLDLFVGGRIRPGEYPLTPRSFLLRNDSKPGHPKFTDISKTQGDDLSEPGMVTGSVWTDFNNDGWIDLVLTGEYMPIRFYQNKQGRLTEVTASTGLTHMNGWWNSLAAGDFDNDGDIDYLAGNLGLNTPYRASGEEPICVYANDYDKDGRIDPVLCHFVDGVEQVFHSRDDINRQMTPFRARFRTYEAYANVAFNEAFTSKEISTAQKFSAENFSSSYIENLGNGRFKNHPLPLTAQLAPIFAMTVTDVDGDGNLDALAVGNSYSTEVQTGRYDAQGFLFLKGNGKGVFEVLRHELSLPYDNKSIVRIHTGNEQPTYIVGINNDSIRAFRQSVIQRSIQAQPLEFQAIITMNSGRSLKEELPYGTSYLSQSSRSVTLPEDARTVVFIHSNGTKRTVVLK